jgi:hypothetical protein
MASIGGIDMRVEIALHPVQRIALQIASVIFVDGNWWP